MKTHTDKFDAQDALQAVVLYRVKKAEEQGNDHKFLSECRWTDFCRLRRQFTLEGAQAGEIWPQRMKNWDEERTNRTKFSQKDQDSVGLKKKNDPEGLDEYQVNWGSLHMSSGHNSGHLLGQLSKRPPK